MNKGKQRKVRERTLHFVYFPLFITPIPSLVPHSSWLLCLSCFVSFALFHAFIVKRQSEINKESEKKKRDGRVSQKHLDHSYYSPVLCVGLVCFVSLN